MKHPDTQSDRYLLAVAIADIFFKATAMLAALGLLAWTLGWRL